MKKHVLFLSYYFPPQRAIAAVRTGAMARALVEADLKVTVVTIARELLVHNEGQALDLEDVLGSRINIIGTGHSWRNLVPGIVHTAPNNGLHWLIGGIFRRAVSFLSLDSEIGWRKHALAAVSAFKSGDVDIILSSGGPWISHQIAAKISKRLKSPYVLDYRDLWSGNPHTPVNWRLITRMEHTLYRGAAAVITVAPSMQDIHRELFGNHPNAIVVTNGYDKYDCDNRAPTAFQDFAIIYAGQFIPPVRIIDPLFMVIRRLMESQVSIPWGFHYYGMNVSYVQEAATRYGVQGKVHIHGHRTRREVLSAVKGSGLAVVVVSTAKVASPAEAGIMTGKIFEIIGLRTPYLIVAPQNADIRKIVETAGGGRAFCADEIGPMAQYIYHLMKGLPISYKTPEKYSWEHLGKNISDILIAIDRVSTATIDIKSASRDAGFAGHKDCFR